MNIDVSSLIGTVIRAIAGEIAKAVLADITPRIDSLALEYAKLHERCARIEDAGSGLSHLLLDDAGYRSKLCDFVDGIVKEHIYQHGENKEHYTEYDITNLIRQHSEGQTFDAMKDDIEDLITSKLNEHDSDRDAHMSCDFVSGTELDTKVEAKIAEDATVRCIVDEIEAYHGNEMVDAILGADGRSFDKLVDKLSTSLANAAHSDTDIANIAGTVFVERLRGMLHEMTHAAVRCLDAEVVR
jgi:hypothetical protein